MSIAEQLMYQCGGEIEDKLKECFNDQLDDIEDIDELVREIADFIDGDIQPIVENYIHDHRNGFIKEVVNEWLEHREEEEEDDE